MNEFQTDWAARNNLEKGNALTRAELEHARALIYAYTKRGISSSKIIKALQKSNPKLSEEYRAARVYWTESKKSDTELIGEAGEDLGLDKYRVILSPNPCPLCVEKTNNGTKIFTQKDIEKTGYGHFVPWHPNCYCIAIPTV